MKKIQPRKLQNMYTTSSHRRLSIFFATMSTKKMCGQRFSFPQETVQVRVCEITTS